MNRGTMGVNSLPKTVTRQRRDCDLNLGPSAPESSTLTTRLQDQQVIAQLRRDDYAPRRMAVRRLCNERKVSGRGVCSGCGVTRRRR